MSLTGFGLHVVWDGTARGGSFLRCLWGVDRNTPRLSAEYNR